MFSRVPAKGIMLQHENASSHSAALTRQFLAEKNIKVIEHHFLKSFSGLGKNLRGRRFSSEEEIDIAVHTYFEGVPKEDWLGAFKQWKVRMVKCIIVGGNYFEHI